MTQILIVDDSELVVSRLSDMLKESSILVNILTAYSYTEAQEKMKQHQPSLVLLDIQLPGKNGIELLSLIKAEYPKVITIMLTNRVSTYYKNLCEAMGANHFIDKSSEFETIPNIIEHYIINTTY